MAETPTGHPIDERTLFAGTTIRFVQLLVLLLVASAGMVMNVGYSFGNEAMTGCVLAAGIDYDRPSTGFHVLYGTHADAWESCIDRHMFAPPSWLGLAWAVLVAAVAAGLFRVLPVVKSKRRGVVALGEVGTDADGAIRRRLEDLKSRAELETLPMTLVDRTAPTASAVVFGADRRPVLRLDAGLLAVEAEDPDRFDAVILHEFAHIRNRDITITYATVALWWSFVALALAPYTASYVIEIPGTFGEVWQGAALLLLARGLLIAALLTALVYLARADVLRTREFCADIAAQEAGSAPHGWTATTAVKDEGRLRRWRGSFAELWRVHPPKNLRRHTLTHPAVLFELHAVPLVLTGAVAVIAAEQMGAGLAIHNSWLDAVTALTGAGLITGVTGIALWRAVVNPAGPGRRSRPPTGVRAGLWLGIGMAVGALPAAGGGLQALPARPEFLPLMVLAGIGFGWWTTQCARVWVGAREGSAGPLRMSLVLAGAWLVLTAWLAWWRSSGMLLVTGVLYDSPYVVDRATTTYDADVDPVYVPLVRFYDVVRPVWVGLEGDVFIWPALTLLWALPLLAWTFGHGLPRLRRVLLAAFIGAVCCWGAVAAGLAYMSPWLPFGEHQLVVYLLLVSAGLVLGAAAAALAGSLLASGLRLAQALIAAHLAVLAGLVGVIALQAADGCIPSLAASQAPCGQFPLSMFLPMYEQVVPQALVLAAIAAFAVVALVSAVARLRGPRRTPVPVSSRLYVRRLSIGMLCGAAAGFVLMASILQATPRSWVAADPEASEDVSSPVAPMIAPEAKAAHIEAWREYGGGDLIADFEDALAAVDELAAGLADGAGSAGVDLTAARSTCAAIVAAADGADEFFPVPDGLTQVIWADFAARARDGAVQCGQATDRRNLSMLADALQAVLDVGAALEITVARLDDLEHR